MIKILIAEDDTFFSSLIVHNFQAAGYEVMGAFDGNETIDRIKSWNPDLIVLDIMMPIKDGYGVLEEIKKDPAYAHIPVMVLSNLGSAADIERAKHYGIVDYLVKANSNPQEVVARVKALLEKQTQLSGDTHA